MPRAARVIGLVTSVTLLATACQAVAPVPSTTKTQPAEAGPAKPKELTKVKFITGATAPALSVVPELAAQLVGFMAEEGLDVEIAGSREGTAQVVQLLANGQIDFGSPPPESVVVPASQGRDVGAMFFYEVGRGAQAEVAVRPDSPIKDWQDMRGATLGIANMGSGAHKATEAALREAGIDPVKDVTFLEIGREAMAAKALQEKTVDVLVQTDTEMATIRERLGVSLRPISLPPSVALTFGASLLTSTAKIKENREQVIGFGRAVAKGTIFGLENPEASVRLYWATYPEAKPKNVSEEEALKIALTELKSRASKWPLDSANDQWGYFKPEQLKAVLAFLGAEGKVKPEIIFTNELIGEINKFDANKVREFARSYKLPS